VLSLRGNWPEIRLDLQQVPGNRKFQTGSVPSLPEMQRRWPLLSDLPQMQRIGVVYCHLQKV